MARRRRPQRNLQGKFSNTRNVGPASNVRGTTPGGSGPSGRIRPIISGDPKLSGPKPSLRLPGPSPMIDITPNSVGRPRPAPRALPSPSRGLSAGRAVGLSTLGLGALGAVVGAAAAFRSTPAGEGSAMNQRSTPPRLMQGNTEAETGGPSSRPNNRPSTPKTTSVSSTGPTSRPKVTKAAPTSSSGTTKVTTADGPAVKEVQRATSPKAGSPTRSTQKMTSSPFGLKGPRMMDEFRSR